MTTTGFILTIMDDDIQLEVLKEVQFIDDNGDVYHQLTEYEKILEQQEYIIENST